METEEILAAIQKAADTIATPNWADKLSVVISFLAIIVAGFVARRQNKIVLKQAEISEQQNKIALFEKRYDVYETVYNVLRFAEEISTVSNADDIWEPLQNIFEQYPNRETENLDSWRMSLILNIHEKLEQAEFLFTEDINELLLLLRTNLLLLTRGTYATFDDESFEERRTMLSQIVEKVKSRRILEKMRKDLQLQSVKI